MNAIIFLKEIEVAYLKSKFLDAFRSRREKLKGEYAEGFTYLNK